MATCVRELLRPQEFVSAASESAIGGLSAAQRREVSGTANFAE